MPRTITCYEVFALWLNSVYANVEQHAPVAWADTPDRLKEWERSQRAPEPYRENGYYLVYRPDSPIKLFNPASFEYDNPWFPAITRHVVEDLTTLPIPCVN